MRVVEAAAVRHVQAPHPHPAAGGADGPRLRLDRLTPARLPREADLHVVQPDPRDDRDAVPLREAHVRHLVPQADERHVGELVVTALGLLHGQHVDVGAFEPGGDPVDASTDRVHVPGGDAHAVERTAAPRQAP
ncbi:hypothetical protein GCM10025868_25550 [Angustibacter aerolatus]|uniref:Uncharacterized protein n=1 Tax=Angustibacter aerolatus TaxID=1162965 RepID=A0ABQ6JJ91_9ACTN|nr:hypothetical protein GCM10025868_25550 [Angustibacter aerolatus]